MSLAPDTERSSRTNQFIHIRRLPFELILFALSLTFGGCVNVLVDKKQAWSLDNVAILARNFCRGFFPQKYDRRIVFRDGLHVATNAASTFVPTTSNRRDEAMLV